MRVAAWSAVAFVATVIVISLLAAMANQVMASWGKVYATGDLPACRRSRSRWSWARCRTIHRAGSIPG